MRFKRGFLVSALSGILFLSIIGGCTSSDEKSIENSEGVTADITASQMEAAKRGRSAARNIITKQWNDSMQLQNAILEARAQSSEYELAGQQKSKAAFDSAFFSMIRTVRPDLADQLQP